MKIEFRYTPQYQFGLNSKAPESEFFDWARRFELVWKKEGSAIVKALKQVTGLSFKTNLLCYVNTSKTFSEPLTLQVTNLMEDNLDNLTHELIHVILTQNDSAIKSEWARLMNMWEESHLTKVHIVVHAIHILLAEYLKYSAEHLERIKTFSQRREYVRSWEIVNKTGAESIVALLQKKK